MMQSIVKLIRNNEELGIFLKTKTGYLRILEEIENFKDAEELPMTLEYHSGEFKRGEKLDSYIQ